MSRRTLICFLTVASVLLLPCTAGAMEGNPFGVHDPLFSTQWGLWNSQYLGQDIGAPLAWKYST